MKAKFRKRATLHCTATSSAQHIKKLWSLDRKCRSFREKYIKFIKFKMVAMHSWLPWKRNIFFEKKSYFRWSNLYGIHSIQIYPCLSIYMVVTIDLKCYSKLQYDISKYHEKSPVKLS